MKLPNGEFAWIDPAKLRDYCLSPTHLRGRNKARVFQAALGVSIESASEVLSRLKQAAKDENAAEGSTDKYGTRFIIDFEWTRNDKTATVRSCWIVPASGDPPRFLTCYIL